MAAEITTLTTLERHNLTFIDFARIDINVFILGIVKLFQEKIPQSKLIKVNQRSKYNTQEKNRRSLRW